MRAAKSDANQAAIVEALRRAGCEVTDTHRHGDGFPDLFVFAPQTGAVHVLEIKVPGGKLTKRERAWHNRHAGCQFVHVVFSVDEALAAIGY